MVTEQKFQGATWKGVAERLKVKEVQNMLVQESMTGKAVTAGYS